MLKSFCIKTNNVQILDYIVLNLKELSLPDLTVSENSFKVYKNIILHYSGNDFLKFQTEISSILTDVIMDFYELLFINRIINTNYFYFDLFERNQIIDIALDALREENDLYDVIYRSFYEYIEKNKYMILDGFANFRLKEYIDIIDSSVEFAVNKFLIDQEYEEFIKLLKAYINSKNNIIDIVHLIYMNGTCILLDKHKNIISLNKDIVNAKYLSDISFSSNDYTLNTLLNILPGVLNIHVIDKEDDFLRTLKLIFGDRVFMCNDCTLCKTYRITSNMVHAETEL